MPHQQLDSVMAEFSKQHIKAAKGTKVANAMAKKQGSVGEDDEAVATASLAVAGEAGEVVAGSAVAGDAGEVVAGSAVACEAGELLPVLQLQGRQSIMLSGTNMQILRMTALVHIVRSPKAWRSVLDPHLKILHQ